MRDVEGVSLAHPKLLIVARIVVKWGESEVIEN